MKMEISIEEKARRYDEAYKKVAVRFGSNVADEIFPELKESEDERIRKGIESIIKHYRDKGEVVCPYPFVTLEEALAWLEKQGEQKPAVEPKFRIGDVIEVKPMKCHGKIFTGEPNKIIDITEESYILDDGKTYSIELQDGWKLSEQKPAWSEEDEARFESCIQELQTTDGYDTVNAKWFKHLKDRVQPKQELSKEDEVTRNALINLVEMYYGGCIDKSEKNRLLSWLKSLKERYTWKPSDEQLEAMQKALVDLCGKDEHNIITGLYYDLKKLREE